MIDTSDWTGLDMPPDGEWLIFWPDLIRDMPGADRAQIQILDGPSTKAAYAAADAHNVVCGDGWGNDPFAGGCYTEVERFDALDAANPPDTYPLDCARAWLETIDVPGDAPVLILSVFATKNTPALLTTWQIVQAYATDVFSSDNLVLVSPSTDWCLYYHHDDIFHFATRETQRRKM